MVFDDVVRVVVLWVDTLVLVDEEDEVIVLGVELVELLEELTVLVELSVVLVWLVEVEVVVLVVVTTITTGSATASTWTSDSMPSAICTSLILSATSSADNVLATFATFNVMTSVILLKKLSVFEREPFVPFATALLL